MKVRVGKTIVEVGNLPYSITVGCETIELSIDGMRSVAREISKIIGDGDRVQIAEMRAQASYECAQAHERTIRSLKGALTKASAREKAGRER